MLSFRTSMRVVETSASVTQLAARFNIARPISVRALLAAVMADNQLIDVEQTSQIENGIIYIKTDNPQIRVTTQLMQVHAEWHNGLVPQELTCEGRGWQFNNGDLFFNVWDGEAEASAKPSRAGSINGKFYAWPATPGQWSGYNHAEVTLFGRGLLIGYKPVTIQLTVLKPRSGNAANCSPTFQVALDPEILLVPVEVICFYSPAIRPPVTLEDQWLLWDQVPIIGSAANFKNIDGSTGEIRSVTRAWQFWPTLSSEGLYEHQGWVSPDSIWGKAGVRFRLVNYIEIETDNEHVAPVRRQGVYDDAILRENNTQVSEHPNHIKDQPLLRVIIMHRIAAADAPEVGRALIGLNAIGISWGVADRFAVLAHEIGHIILSSRTHSNLPNNVMNDPGPGTDISPEQAEAARRWASSFRSFWQFP